MSRLERHIEGVAGIDPLPARGRITQAIGLVLEGSVAISEIGELCRVISAAGDRELLAEVVGFREDRVLLMPLGEVAGIGPGSTILPTGERATAAVGDALLGRVIDGLGEPLDGLGPLQAQAREPLYRPPPNPLDRRRIQQPLDIGIRAINGLLTCGRGQRLGIFAGSGVGKSMLLGMIAKNTAADVSVIALIGERGREVREFIDRDLGESGRRRAVVVAATADQPPLIRRRAAFLAMTLAEYFRAAGRHVLMMMDSLTRLAQAQREIGLAVGEPPTTKGYTPSVFTLLPQFLERAGTCGGDGAITGLFTVLVEGDDLNDPIADAARAALDGHVVLARELAARNHFPAIDVLNSTSRVMLEITAPAHWERARAFLDLVATYQRAEDLIQIGAYKSGSNPKIDRAISHWEAIEAYLQQGIHERAPLGDSIAALERLLPG